MADVGWCGLPPRCSRLEQCGCGVELAAGAGGSRRAGSVCWRHTHVGARADLRREWSFAARVARLCVAALAVWNCNCSSAVARAVTVTDSHGCHACCPVAVQCHASSFVHVRQVTVPCAAAAPLLKCARYCCFHPAAAWSWTYCTNSWTSSSLSLGPKVHWACTAHQSTPQHGPMGWSCRHEHHPPHVHMHMHMQTTTDQSQRFSLNSVVHAPPHPPHPTLGAHSCPKPGMRAFPPYMILYRLSLSGMPFLTRSASKRVAPAWMMLPPST